MDIWAYMGWKSDNLQALCLSVLVLRNLTQIVRLSVKHVYLALPFPPSKIFFLVLFISILLTYMKVRKNIEHFTNLGVIIVQGLC